MAMRQDSSSAVRAYGRRIGATELRPPSTRISSELSARAPRQPHPQLPNRARARRDRSIAAVPMPSGAATRNQTETRTLLGAAHAKGSEARGHKSETKSPQSRYLLISRVSAGVFAVSAGVSGCHGPMTSPGRPRATTARDRPPANQLPNRTERPDRTDED